MARPGDTATKQAETKQMLARLWERSAPVVRKRIDVLSAAASAASAGTLTPEIRLDAISEAHKLAGSLGMFGFLEGTELAREVEIFLEEAPAPSGQHLSDLVAMLRSTLFPDTP